MTPGSIKNKRLASLCILGWVAFNYPLLSLMNREVFVFGIPLLYLFLFLGWALLIVLMACITFFRPRTSIPDYDERRRRTKKRPAPGKSK